jgi:hypothetical protein
MGKLMQAALAGIALGLLLTGTALADCASCGSGKGSCKHDHGDNCKCGNPARARCKCKSKSRSCCWGDQGVWVACSDGCCPPQAGAVRVCVSDCGCRQHPYEASFNGSSMLCDTGCSAYLPCKRVGVMCETKCEEHVRRDCNGCEQVQYTTTQECHEIERPRVVPWWFSGGKGNTYLEDGATAVPMVDDWAGGRKMTGAAGSPELKDKPAPAEDKPAAEEQPAKSAN